MLQELLSLNIFGFFLIFDRVGATFMLLPGFSAAFVSFPIRLQMALAVSFLLAPVLMDSLPVLPATPAELGLLFLGESTVGILLGVLARIIMGALQTMGTLTAYFSSLANAFIQDPIAEQQSSLFAGFLSTLGMLLIFATGMHHLMLKALVDSYSLFAPGEALPFTDFSHLVARRVMDSFRLGVMLVSPLMITGITYYVGLGLLGRLMPQLPVFFFGLPIQITMQIAVLMMTLSTAMMVFLSRFEDAFSGFLVP